MSNLMPQVRVNKNGVPVLKYVRPENAEKAQRLIPTLSTSTRKTLNCRSLKDAIKAAADDGWYKTKNCVFVLICWSRT